MSHAKYLELNDRLAEVMFSFERAGRPVYVGAEESGLLHDEWDSADRRYFSEASMKLLTADPEEVTIAAIDAA